MTWLGSAVIAAAVSAIFSVITTFFSVFIAERRIAVENVIQERKNWRKDIREIASEIHQALSSKNEIKLRELKSKFTLLVNPHDQQDQEILTLIKSETAANHDTFNQRVALLLKHDWERAKYEASLWKRVTTRPPVRVPSATFQPGVEHQYRRTRWFWR